MGNAFQQAGVAPVRADFIAGMGKVAGRFVIIPDIRKALSVDEIAILAGVADGSTESTLAS